MSQEAEEKELTPEERLEWLRARGIVVETPEERRAKAIASIMREPDAVSEEEDPPLEFGLSGCRADSQMEKSVDGSNNCNVISEAGYSWTQTEEELEVTVTLPPDTNVESKGVAVTFRPRHICLFCQDQLLLDLELFEAIDADGSTWTLDRSGETAKIVVTMEKVEEALWARIKD